MFSYFSMKTLILLDKTVFFSNILSCLFCYVYLETESHISTRFNVKSISTAGKQWIVTIFIDISNFSENNYLFADNTTFENFKHIYINNNNTFFQK